jgi:hypothetical protein
MSKSKNESLIHQDNIPGHMLAKFMMELLPALKWERLTSKAIVYNHDEEERESRVRSG